MASGRVRRASTAVKYGGLGLVSLLIVVFTSLVEFPAHAYAQGSCVSAYSCTVGGGGSGGGSGNGGGGGGNNGGGSGAPVYPPPEPNCVDQGGNIRPYSVNSNLTINGQTYDDEFVDCSSTGAGYQETQRDNGTFSVITQSPNNPNPLGNSSCGDLLWWVDADTAYDYHRSAVPGASYWGARAGIGTYTPNSPVGRLGPNRYSSEQIASFCQVWFLVPYLNTVTGKSNGYSWTFDVSTDLPPTLPAPQWEQYTLPDLSSRNPGGIQNIYPPYQQDSTVSANGEVKPPQDSPYGPVALTNTPYVVDPEIPTQTLYGTRTTSAPIVLNNNQQVGTVTLTMHYTAVPQGVQIFDPLNTLPTQPLLTGSVLSYNNFCTIKSPASLKNSQEGFSQAASDFEQGALIPDYQSLVPTQNLCEVQFALPSVMTQAPHNAWPLVAKGKWSVTYTSATYSANFVASPFRTDTGQVIALPSNISGTIAPGSTLWPTNPSGMYYGFPSTTNVRVASAESVPVLQGQ